MRDFRQTISDVAEVVMRRVYGQAHGAGPEFYAHSRTLEACKEAQNPNAAVTLTTDSDYCRCQRLIAASR